MKKLLSVILAVGVLLSCSLTVSAANIGEIYAEEMVKAQFLALAEAQKDAVAAHEVLYSSFLVDGQAEPDYPDNYGGDYIEDNILHICIVDLPHQDLTEYETLLSDYQDDILFEDVEHSLETLLASAGEVAEDLEENGVSVVSYSISERDNGVIIGIQPAELSELEVQCVQSGVQARYIQEDSPYDVPVFFSEEEPLELATSLMGGSGLYGYTLGVCGTYQGNPAFAMCGHGLSGTGASIHYQYETGPVIGTVSVHQYAAYENGDYAIVTITNDNFTTTNIVGDPGDPEGQYQISYSLTRPATGTSLIKYGKNSGYAYGTVSSMYSSAFIDGTYIENLVYMSVTSGQCVDGDSGGPIFTPDGGFCGTVTGHSTFPVAGDIYFSPYQYLRNAGFLVKTN